MPTPVADPAALVGRQIVALPAGESLDLIREIYPAIHAPRDRRRVLKPFVEKRDHEHIVKVLHLAAIVQRKHLFPKFIGAVEEVLNKRLENM